MTTLVPRGPYTPLELNELYHPQELDLRQVQVFLRHGERTPTSDRFRHLGLPAYWPFCYSGMFGSSTILHSHETGSDLKDPKIWSSLQWRRIVNVIEDKRQKASVKADPNEKGAICISGQLTDLGRRTTLALGQRLRHLYVDQLKFLPETLSNSTGIYMRTTHMLRAQESLQEAFTGLYQPYQRDASFVPVINTRRSLDDPLVPNNYGCTRYNELFTLFSKQAAALLDESPMMDMLNKKLRKHMPDNNVLAVRGHPAIAGITDTNNARRAHGLPLPKEFDDPEVIQALDTAATTEWFAGFQQNREHRMVGIGGLIGDINENIANHIDKTESSFNFSMNGCHDSTLAAILGSLGMFRGENWPPFTSHIAVELFQAKNSAEPTSNKSWFTMLSFLSSAPTPISRTPTSQLSTSQAKRLDGYYVRMRYNDRPVTIPGCKLPGKHLSGDESFCTLGAFKEICDKMVPRDWQEACNSNLGKGIIAEENIEAGY